MARQKKQVLFFFFFLNNFVCLFVCLAELLKCWVCFVVKKSFDICKMVVKLLDGGFFLRLCNFLVVRRVSE